MRLSGVADADPVKSRTWCRGRALRPLFLAGAAALCTKCAFLSLAALRSENPRGSPLVRGFRTAIQNHADRTRIPRQLQAPGAAGDPVNNVSPEMSAAGKVYAQRYEDLFLSGNELWAAMKQGGNDKRIYVIGTNGNQGDEVSESLCDALGYVQAADGTYFIHRKPGDQHTPIRYSLWNSDKKLAEKSKISPVDLFIENEEKYRDLETEVLKDFESLDTEGYPAVIVVGEGAVTREENIEIMKRGIVIWLDVDPQYSWMKTQARQQSGGGLYVPPEFADRPPVWAIANGWDGDIDDAEGKIEYIEVVKTRRDIYEQISDIRLRTDIPGIGENSYWAAERLIKALREHLGISKTEVSVEEEVLEKDLSKFLEGARLSKYLKPALDWCDEQGAASIEDIVENVGDFGEALSLKPLELKRLQKAAATVAVG